MRAVVADRYGGPDVLRVAYVDRPVPDRGEVVVEVLAAGTNPVDAEARTGAAKGWFGNGPWVWGWDVCGVVVELGPGVAGLAVGDRVVGMPRFPEQASAYAEYLTAPAGELAPAPRQLDHRAAAALPLRGLTALQILDLAGVDRGQRVLVHGAAGCVGHMAVQLAADRGAAVIGVARSTHHAFLRGLGAQEVLEPAPEALPAAAVDVVVDCVGDDRLLAAVRRGGVLAPVPGAARGATALEEAADAAGVRVLRHVVRPDGAGLRRLVGLVDAGRLVPDVAAVLELADAVRAHEMLDARRHRGAIVLEIGQGEAPCA